MRKVNRRPVRRFTRIAAITASLLILESIALLGTTVFGIMALFVDDDFNIAALVCMSAAIASAIPSLVLFYIWLHEAWYAVAPAHDRPSPGAAIGLLFIPFFNFYWLFRAIPGLSYALETDWWNQFPNEEPPSAGRIVAIFACVLSFIPPFSLFAPCLFAAWIVIANSVKNRLVDARSNAQKTLPT